MSITKKLLSIFIPDYFKTDAFEQQVIKEQKEKYRREKNKNIKIKSNQCWRSPLDLADKYSSPVFLKVKEIKGDLVFYTTNYSKKLEKISKNELRNEYLFVN